MTRTEAITMIASSLPKLNDEQARLLAAIAATAFSRPAINSTSLPSIAW